MLSKGSVEFYFHYWLTPSECLRCVHLSPQTRLLIEKEMQQKAKLYRRRKKVEDRRKRRKEKRKARKS